MGSLATLVTTVGVVTAPPRLHHTATGSPRVDLTIEVPVNSPVDDDAQTDVMATRHDVRISGPQALNVNASVGPGDRVVVVGRLVSYVHVDGGGQRFRRARVLADVVATSLETATAVLTPSGMEHAPDLSPSISSQH
ncbi:single-stranded DNA-binding protein [Cellulomonas sp. HD19AZ1]|uniref:single-stranded DNA-binding protein n=1 Tax=Cellulomonas sp. HD19AZ1 TaxID=2559593 RepID=UPI001070DBA0|nr:single-stranded DNA-binding protein [Cellulomonas sp. HD19AZ1]TFH68149.1 hypothetical protein E4A51_18055 [Cellulomonas sp. HD19AZ1]